MYEEECVLCRKLSGHKTWIHDVFKGNDTPDRIIRRKNGVATQIGVGPLTPGYLLIIPEEHYYSLGQVSGSVLKEVQEQKQDFARIIEQEYGSVLCFEHGAVSQTKRGGACVDHVHLHLIPGCTGFREIVSADYDEIPISGIHDLKQFSDKKTPYLFVDDIDHQSYAYEVPERIPSQYLRRVWAQLTGRPDQWDWGLYPNWEMMDATSEMINRRMSG